MRIKKIAFLGTLLLIAICIFLYLSLDRTLSRHYKLGFNTPGAVVSESEYILKTHDTQQAAYQGYSNEDSLPVCVSVSGNPTVDVQMAEVYDQLEFDNINGGVWRQGWNITYNENQWRKNKLKIFLVPHSHNDPGWKKTFEEYYQSQTRAILNNMVVKLMEDERRKFIWAEISFFSLWWSEINEYVKQNVKGLISRGQLEFVTGGWVMNDEANSHYYSVFQQLFHGHQWLLNNLNYTPKYSWSIDPFGLSPTMPYILKKMDFSGLAVQRSHYSVKKHLARNKQLEFNWRQLWDGSGATSLLTHMMPFYSYDVPHTCGPDPKICCQFDFKRLPGYGVSCPWKVYPQRINKNNLPHRAGLLLDQYKKKALLYRTNVLLVPLGDDFRYDTANEWDVQYNNYRMLFDYINSSPDFHAQAEFGTLSDYFKALMEEKSADNFPSLSGDFFTYADRDDHYWSGYYTSRPFHKRMDRVLISTLRSGELLLTLAARVNRSCEAWTHLLNKVSDARSSLSLFQHHDGITGTAKDHVVNDYANKMLEALKLSQQVIQQAAHFLLSNGKADQRGDEVFFIVDGHGKMGDCCDSQETIVRFSTAHSLRKVTLFNSLTSTRREIVTIKVDSQLVKVLDPSGETILHQLSPFCNLSATVPTSCYLLSFYATIPPLSLVTYSILPSDDDSGSLSTMRLMNWNRIPIEDWPTEQVLREQTLKEFNLENEKMSLNFSKKGLLKSITLKLPESAVTVPVSLTFLRYYARRSEERSGAYLFLPEGSGETINSFHPQITVIQGGIYSRVIVRLPQVVHTVTLYNSPGADGYGFDIQNLVDISSINDNYELAMRFSTDIKNGHIFYTDLNGIQIIKRKRLNKLPLQGNYYPMPSLAYIEDSNMRLTLLSGQPLGVAALTEGQIEVMQDRRLLQDDNRGLDQGVMDNRPTLNVFRLLLEPIKPACRKEDDKWGRLSVEALESSHSLLYPIDKLLWLVDESLGQSWGPPATSRVSPNLHIVTAITMPTSLDTSLVLNVSPVDHCVHMYNSTILSQTVGLASLLPMKSGDKVFRSALSFSSIKEPLFSRVLPLCEIDITSFYITNSI